MMESKEHETVTDADARLGAKALAALFSSPLKVFGKHGFDKPVTLADAVHLGGILIGSINSATINPQLKEQTAKFAKAIAERIYLDEALEEFLYERIRSRVENPAEIYEAITKVEVLYSGPGAIRRFLSRAIKEGLPKARKGRPTEFKPATDPKHFLKVSASLKGICGRFLNLREQYPQKHINAILDFLKDSDPTNEGIVRKHATFVAETIDDFDFRALKGEETRSRRLADAIAGKHLFGWTFKYSVQRAGEFRRTSGLAAEEEK